MGKESFGNTLGGCLFLFCLGVALVMSCIAAISFLGNYLQTL